MSNKGRCEESAIDQAGGAAVSVRGTARASTGARGTRTPPRATGGGLVAVNERDASIQAAERRAGHALRAMTDREGLSLREVVEWCGGEITMRDAMRMRRLVSDP